jgi:hypothetical protein
VEPSLWIEHPHGYAFVEYELQQHWEIQTGGSVAACRFAKRDPILAGSLHWRRVMADTFKCCDRLLGNSPALNRPDTPCENALVDQCPYTAATQTKASRHVQGTETVGEFAPKNVNRRARHQPHASATVSGRMDVAFQDIAVDQLRDGRGSQSQQASRFCLTDPMSPLEQILVFGTLEETHFAIEMTKRVVPQEIGSECVGRCRLPLLLKIVRLTN